MQKSALAVRSLMCLAALSFVASCLARTHNPAEIDNDLLEVTVPGLQTYYTQHKYTVTQVVRWYLERIHRYDGIYRSIETVTESDALANAAREDAEAARGSAVRGPLWGVPMVIKANTSIEGQITTDGWVGFKIPGFELLAPKDASIVAKFRAAGAIIIGHANMPDFAHSDTNRSSSFGRTGNAYDVRFSPGGSSGGVATAVTANMAVLGSGTDTGNSIRMPAASSALIGVLPTRGLVSIAGITPGDWLLDNAGPIARTVTDAAIALSVMAGEDALDPATAGSAASAQPGPYTRYLKSGALRGKRFGVPAFILKGSGIPFHGIPFAVSEEAASKLEAAALTPLQATTRAAFMKAVEELRAAGATVVFDDSILPESFARIASRVSTYPYVREGTDQYLKNFGPKQYHSAAEYEKALGSPLGNVILGEQPNYTRIGDIVVTQTDVETSSESKANYFDPRRRALEAYIEPLERLRLDGYVYPAIQMPPVDETMAQDGRLSEGPHSDTSWVNMIGVPAVVVVGGFYPGGLPFGLEFSARPWRDGDLLGYAYSWEQATRHRHPPVLVDHGLLTNVP
jgi:amidase